MKNPLVLIKMLDDSVEEVRLFTGPTALPKAMKEFREWTGVSYTEYVNRFFNTADDSIDILGEEYAGTAIYFNSLCTSKMSAEDQGIEPMISLNTAHITYEADQLLREGLSMGDLIHYPKAEYGYFICVLDPDGNNKETSLPCCLQDILGYARSKGGQWLMLDRDAEVVSELPVYDW